MSQTDSPPFRSGIVALLGRPNVGKSTLMNYLIGDKVSIITPVAQTTRNQIRGIQTLDDEQQGGPAQIVYLDTPGVHHARTALNRYMVDVAKRSLEGVDLILYLADIHRPDPAVLHPDQAPPGRRNPGFREDAYILKHLKTLNTPKFLVVNKIDNLSKKERLLPFIEQYNADDIFEEVIPISALSGENTDVLVQEICKRLPEGPPLFPSEYATDHPERFLVGEIVREKVILHTRQELPHSTAVLVEYFDESERGDFDDHDGPEVFSEADGPTTLAEASQELPLDDEPLDDEPLDDEPLDDESLDEPLDDEAHPQEPSRGSGLVRIDATIVVERDSQKGIIIGKRGSMLKEIGSQARTEIEALLGCRVFLKLWVKVEKNWSHKNRSLRLLGYRE